MKHYTCRELSIRLWTFCVYIIYIQHTAHAHDITRPCREEALPSPSFSSPFILCRHHIAINSSDRSNHTCIILQFISRVIKLSSYFFTAQIVRKKYSVQQEIRNKQRFWTKLKCIVVAILKISSQTSPWTLEHNLYWRYLRLYN